MAENEKEEETSSIGDLRTEDLLRQINVLRNKMKKSGVMDVTEEFYVEEDGTKNFEKKHNGSWKTGYHPNTRKMLWTAEDHPIGGRPKGSKNKKTLRQEAIDKGQYTPAEFLISVVNDENANMGQRISAAKEAAKFYDPTLASVEVHTDEDNEAPFNIFLGEMKGEDNKDTDEE
jgi:hypothetical protein